MMSMTYVLVLVAGISLVSLSHVDARRRRANLELPEAYGVLYSDLSWDPKPFPLRPIPETAKLGACFQPKVTGDCKAFLTRFYYDRKSKNCQQFVYGGCGGNGNNFKRLELCERKCNVKKGATKDLCELPPVTGRCRARFIRYYYDSTAGRCQTFTYGGCRGNGNRFDTQDECMSRCGGFGSNGDYNVV